MSDTTAITEYAGKEIHRGTAGTVPNREGD